MTSDPNDELARKRAERARGWRSQRPGAIDDPPTSTEQEAAITRARESWALSQPDSGQTSQRGTTDGG